MIIAVDFDDTYTRDSLLWDGFREAARAAGHRVVMVTCRRDTDENRRLLAESAPDWPAFFTNLDPKREHMLRRGIAVDVWCDDDPRCILEGK